MGNCLGISDLPSRHRPAYVKTAIQCECDQHVVNLRAVEVKNGDVLIAGLDLADLMVGASLSDNCVVKMVMAAVDNPAPVQPYLFPTRPHNQHSRHGLGECPFYNI